MILILIRHGESTGQGRYIGRRSDPPLSPLGGRQAAACASLLAAEPLAAVYAGPLARALRTAERIAERHGLRVERVPELAEIDFGEWEGLDFEEIGERDSGLRYRWIASIGGEAGSDAARAPGGALPPTPPNGESIPSFDSRVRSALDKIIASAAGSCVAIVTHAGVIRSVFRRILECPFPAQWRIEVAPGSISRVRAGSEGDFRIELVNGRHHLNGLERRIE
jgi:probable phosphoglycerate mutase